MEFITTEGQELVWLYFGQDPWAEVKLSSIFNIKG